MILFPQYEARARTLTIRAAAKPRQELTSSPWIPPHAPHPRKGEGCKDSLSFCRNTNGTGRRLTEDRAKWGRGRGRATSCGGRTGSSERSRTFRRPRCRGRGFGVMLRTYLISLIAPPSIAPLMRARLGARRGVNCGPTISIIAVLALLFLVTSFVV